MVVSMPSKKLVSFAGARRGWQGACLYATDGSRPRADVAAVLRALIRESPPRDVLVRIAEYRIVRAGVDPDGPVLVFADASHVDLERLPRVQAFGNLVGKRPDPRLP